MMTTNLFAIANVKQLRTYLVLEFYCLFFRTSWCVGVINSAIFFFFNSFHNRVAFDTIFWRALGIWGGGVWTPEPPLGTPLNKTIVVLLTAHPLLVYEILWNNILQAKWPQLTIWCMRLHAGYLRLQTHTPLQQWLHESASMLRYT